MDTSKSKISCSPHHRSHSAHPPTHRSTPSALLSFPQSPSPVPLPNPHSHRTPVSDPADSVNTSSGSCLGRVTTPLPHSHTRGHLPTLALRPLLHSSLPNLLEEWRSLPISHAHIYEVYAGVGVQSTDAGAGIGFLDLAPTEFVRPHPPAASYRPQQSSNCNMH